MQPVGIRPDHEGEGRFMQPIQKDLLDILACPKCKGPVRAAGDFIQCTAPNCGLRYPVRDGIPIMLIEEAQAPKTDIAAARPT